MMVVLLVDMMVGYWVLNLVDNTVVQMIMLMAVQMADYLVDIGPKAGKLGGNIVAIGTPEEVMANPNSPTGQYLIGVETINIPKNRRPVTIKGLRDVPKSLLIKELKEEWLDEVDSLIKD